MKIEHSHINKEYAFPNHLLEFVIELSESYEDIVSPSEIEVFKGIATPYDAEYINQLLGKCVHWTLKKDWGSEYQDKLKRDEIKVLERVKYRVERGR